MATVIDIEELPNRLEEVLALLSAGVEIVVVQGPVPRARLVPLEPEPTTRRRPGLHPHAMEAADDFDAPLFT